MRVAVGIRPSRSCRNLLVLRVAGRSRSGASPSRLQSTGRAREKESLMSTRQRWEDWISVVAGVVLFVTPFVFSGTAITSAAWTAFVAGVLLVIVGVWNLARPS